MMVVTPGVMAPLASNPIGWAFAQPQSGLDLGAIASLSAPLPSDGWFGWLRHVVPSLIGPFAFQSQCRFSGPEQFGLCTIDESTVAERTSLPHKKFVSNWT